MRLLRGTVAFGGVNHDLTADGRNELLGHLRALETQFDSLITLLIDSGSFTDRVDTTGILSNQAARDLGIVGMAARASGIDTDFRRDHPHDAYASLRFEVPVESGGDVRARLMVRAREVEQSFLILARALDALPDTPLRSPMPDALPAGATALGWAEAWRGPCVHWVATDERGRLTRVKITDPSFLNWPGLAHAVPGNIIPDFPVINKSFNLSYSGNDR
jgi:Ni,Fe-hydrogenase III large subunit